MQKSTWLLSCQPCLSSHATISSLASRPVKFIHFHALQLKLQETRASIYRVIFEFRRRLFIRSTVIFKTLDSAYNRCKFLQIPLLLHWTMFRQITSWELIDLHSFYETLLLWEIKLCWTVTGLSSSDICHSEVQGACSHKPVWKHPLKLKNSAHGLRIQLRWQCDGCVWWCLHCPESWKRQWNKWITVTKSEYNYVHRCRGFLLLSTN